MLPLVGEFRLSVTILVPFRRTPLSTAYCKLVMNVGSFDRLTVVLYFNSTNLAHVAAPSTGDENVRAAVWTEIP